MQFARRSSAFPKPLLAGVTLGLCAFAGSVLLPTSVPEPEPIAGAFGGQPDAVQATAVAAAPFPPNPAGGGGEPEVTGPLSRPSPFDFGPMPRPQAELAAAAGEPLGILPPPRPRLAAAEHGPGTGPGTAGPMERAQLDELLTEAAGLVDQPPSSLREASALTCLATSIYHEARDQPLLGQQAVAAVILRRVAMSRWGDTICAVVQPSQFSYLTEDYGFPPILERSAWREALTVAVRAVVDGPAPLVAEADHYHATYVNPSWGQDMQVVLRIGGHVFYRDPLSGAPAAARDA